MNTLKYLRNLISILSLIILPYPIFSQYAPITTAAIITACPGDNDITVPLTVVNFTNIMSMTLRIEYDSTVMQFDSASSSFPALPGAMRSSKRALDVGPSIWKIGLVWTNTNPVTLANGSILANLKFDYINGASTLHFNNESSLGDDCQYVDNNLVVLTDTLTSTYYHNGQVSSAALPGSVAGGSTIDYGAGTGTLTLSGYSGSVLKWQKQYNDEDYTDITNTAETYSETPAYTGTWNYRAMVQNSPCNAVYSAPTTVTVLTPAGTSKTWTGATSTDWKTPTNWDPHGTPMASDNLIIPATTNKPEVTNTFVGFCNNLNILDGAKLTVNPANNLKVAGTLTIGP